MDYQTLRQHIQSHFKARLDTFKDAVLTHGPVGRERMAGIGELITAAKSDRETFINHTFLDDRQRLVTEFCKQQEIPDDFSEAETEALLIAYQAANLQLAEAALAFNVEQSVFELGDARQGDTGGHTVGSVALGLPASLSGTKAPHGALEDPIQEVVERHLNEGCIVPACGGLDL